MDRAPYLAFLHSKFRFRHDCGQEIAPEAVPLQFDIVERLIERFSNRGETVLDPFGGLMTVPYCAIRLGRRGIGVELNADYYADGLRYLHGAEREATSLTLFDMEGLGSKAA